MEAQEIVVDQDELVNVVRSCLCWQSASEDSVHRMQLETNPEKVMKLRCDVRFNFSTYNQYANKLNTMLGKKAASLYINLDTNQPY